MEKHYELTDSAFVSSFATLTLNPALFTHEAHLRLAWIHIRNYGIDKAIENVCEQIKSFAEFHGDHKKFNKTVTVAAVRAVYHFMLRSTTTDFRNFISENYRLKTSFKELINAHYSTNIFTSEQARATYLEPELLPFD